MNPSDPRLMHRSDAPVLTLDRPWEDGQSATVVTAMPDPNSDHLLLYYLVRNASDPLQNVLCLARSSDGIHWTKPDVDQGTNIVMRSSGLATEWGTFMPTSVLHDPAEEDPGFRWKMIYWDRIDPSLPAGICLAQSPDGLHWIPCRDTPIVTGANDAQSAVLENPRALKGPHASQVLIYQQTWKHNPGLPTERDNLKCKHRVISIWNADEFNGRWVGPTLILEPDEKDAPDLQFYWMTPFQTPTGYGGLLNCHHTGDQTMDIQLVSSRDGWTWKRELNRTPILPLGEAGRYDCGMVTAGTPPVSWRGRTLLFFNARASVHDHQPRYPDQPLPNPEKGIGLAEFSPDLMTIGELPNHPEKPD